MLFYNLKFIIIFKNSQNVVNINLIKISCTEHKSGFFFGIAVVDP